MKLSNDGLRKAAILVSSLDQAAADAVLDQLSPEQARQVRQLVVDMPEPDGRETQQVIDEFFRAGPRAAQQYPPGIELDGSLARRLAMPGGMGEGDRPVSLERQPGKSPPFEFLCDAEGDKLARLLAEERPQTIALVLSRLPAQGAGNVLARLQPGLQVDVIHRLVDLEETDPQILREVEESLYARFSQQIEMQRRPV
ncbi:MAG: hypothetical protein ABSG68_24965, partial [Thermoguttaceae bacterium]